MLPVKLLDEGGRREIAGLRLQPLAITEDLELLSNLTHRLRARLLAPMVSNLVLDGSQEVFHRRIVGQLPLRLIKGYMPNCVRSL